MAERNSGQLLGYLLGALDDAERREIDERLPHDPKLRRRLARAKARLARLRPNRRERVPTPGLAERTFRLVALFSRPMAARKGDRRQTADRRNEEARPRAARMSQAAVPPTSTSGWRWADLTVVATVLLFASLATFAAIQTARNRARLVSCQDNLRQLGVHFVDVRASQRGYVPMYGQRIAPIDDSSFPSQMSLPSAAIVPGHQGINATAFGPNVLFGDGHAAFVCTAMWAPALDEFTPRDSGLRAPRNLPANPIVDVVDRQRR